jgi:hypothetical protein
LNIGHRDAIAQITKWRERQRRCKLRMVMRPVQRKLARCIQVITGKPADVLTASIQQAAVECADSAAIRFVDHPNTMISEAINNLQRTVGRTVIADHKLEIAKSLCKH